MNKPLILPTGAGGWMVWLQKDKVQHGIVAFGSTWREAWANWCAKGYNK